MPNQPRQAPNRLLGLLLLQLVALIFPIILPEALLPKILKRVLALLRCRRAESHRMFRGLVLALPRGKTHLRRRAEVRRAGHPVTWVTS